ncbi:MAG: universal stress protein [Solirubrobacteraceae bacterium]|nr:universal stress protein [Solirubrobacteraceae bacterium]
MSPYQFDNPLVAIDGSEGAQRALDCALSLVERLGGQLTALVVEGKLNRPGELGGSIS